MKSDKKAMKVNIINNLYGCTLISKEAFSLSKEIALILISMVENQSLNKYNPNVLNPKILAEMSNSKDFGYLKEKVAEIQLIKLNFKSSNEELSFWLNMYNFLTLFTVIIKNEILVSKYEWTRFLSNSYFNIAGEHMSLEQIFNRIMTLNLKFNEKNMTHLIKFAISIPTE